MMVREDSSVTSPDSRHQSFSMQPRTQTWNRQITREVIGLVSSDVLKWMRPAFVLALITWLLFL